MGRMLSIQAHEHETSRPRTSRPLASHRRRRRVRIGSARLLAEALQNLAILSRAVELSYRAAEKRVRDRGLGAQLSACAEQVNHMFNLAHARLEAFANEPSPTPYFPRFKKTIDDAEILEALVRLEAILLQSSARACEVVFDDAVLARDLYDSHQASQRRGAWLHALLA